MLIETDVTPFPSPLTCCSRKAFCFKGLGVSLNSYQFSVQTIFPTQMTTYGLPLFLEDTSGHINGSNYADIYDRRPYLHLAVTVHTDRVTRYIYVMDSKPSRLRHSSSQLPDPAVTLEFGPNHSLGTITYRNSGSKSMENYLRKVSKTGRQAHCSLRHSLSC